MSTLPIVFAYFGPETVMPVTSLVATVVGVLLMVGRTGWRLVFRRPGRAVAPPRQAGLRGPHVSVRRRTEATAVSASPDRSADA